VPEIQVQTRYRRLKKGFDFNFRLRTDLGLFEARDMKKEILLIVRLVLVGLLTYAGGFLLPIN
jgi:hypothetical protein